MLIQEFEQLNEVEKEEAVWNHGVFLINYDEGNHMCDIYELYDFYVSFCYELHQNKKADIKASLNPDELPLLSKLNRII